MKMSTRGRYGLRAMLELARCSDGSALLMSTLAEREGLSRKYLHTILTALKRSGLVASVRGAGGGFRLTRPPEQIRLSDVLRAVEGPLSLVPCVNRPKSCLRTNGCAARTVWVEISRAIETVLDAFTLSSLLHLQEASTGISPPAANAARTSRSKTRDTGKGKTK